uniref:Complement C3-like n=1 Tax=Sinocyclocheilus grahami TaxID=75366 RepID=A0A672LIE0_SINGR
MFWFRFSVLAPAKIRPGTKQNILLEGHKLSQALEVSIMVYDYPASQSALMTGSVILNSDNNYSALKTIEIDPNLLQSDGKKKYVKLVAQFSRFHRTERVLTVSFRSGYIFIQTDKPVYNPGDTVRCRAFVSDAEFHAAERTISLEIQNPDGIAVYGMSRAKAIDGILSNTYPLSSVVKEGKWKVVAKFDQGKENSREFEVKKYVLPAFNVTLSPKTSHLRLDAEKLEVEITARYLYGEPVKGVAYVLFGIEIDGEKKRLTSMKQIKDLNGGNVSLSMEEIKRAYPDTNSLLGSSVYVKASVMTSSGSDLVEAEKSGIKIVMSPYMLSIRDTPKYFKPGLPLGMTHICFILKVSHSQKHIEKQYKIVYNSDPSLKPEQQAIQEMRVEPYASFNDYRNYLHISVGSSRVVVGDTFNVQAHIKSNSPERKKLVLNKGNIVHAVRMNVKDLDVINIPLLVTSEMLPAFRFVAYYILPWQHRAEVVADSVFVDVEDRCVGSLSVGPVEGEKLNSYSPGSSITFEVKGDPGAKVSLVAVDNAIFLLSKNRLTQKKVWEVVGQGDMGCTAGGGRNNMAVFSDAGLMFYSSTGGYTDIKDCSSRSRRRRSAAKLQLREQLGESFLQRCCVDGMREIPMPYSCYRRSLYITEDWSCVLAFLRCCAEYRGEELGVVTRPPTTTLPPPTTSAYKFHMDYFEERVLFRAPARTELFGLPGRMGSPPILEIMGMSSILEVREDSYDENIREEEEEEVEAFDEDDLADLEDIYVRSKFFESWLWTDIRLPSVPKSDGLAVLPVNTVLPDSITQWGFLAVSASPQTGFCVAEPYNVRASKPFFIDLRLPHSVSRNEHVEIKAVVHNYRNSKLEVMVILEKTEDMCSVAFSGQHRQQVSVPAGSSKLISYTMIPLKTGELPLQVTAVAASFMGQDAVRKNLRVVVSELQKPALSWVSPGRQQIEVEKMQLDAVVPKSLPETFVNVRGDLLADSIDNSIKEDSLAALIRMPGGCVEQNLARITLPLIAAHYLDRSGNWDAVGIDRREEAIKYIQKGYENQLNYRKKDDSYPPYSKEGTSTWITAYVVKVFSMAKSFISVDEKHLCGPLVYLLKNKQRPDGSFQEDNPVYDTSMTGGLQGSESRVSLTAFVLIALAEAQNAVTCQEPDLNIQVTSHFPRLTRPYTAAIACYALAVSNHDRTHWPDSSNYFFTLEATGYALLALIKAGHMEEAAASFRWLNEKRGIGGGYGSTQSTMVVLQALSEYLVKRPPPDDLNLLVQLSVPGRSDVRWTFNPKIAYVARSSRVRTSNFQTLFCRQIWSYYQCWGNALQIIVFFLLILLILDIGLPTGFEPENSDLELLTNSVDRYINNFQVVDNLSDRGSLIIHLFKVSSTQTDVISFRLHQKFKVGLLQPSTVTVYQYYNKDKRCSRFYSPPEDKQQLDQICKDSVCRCSQGDCCVLKEDSSSVGKDHLQGQTDQRQPESLRPEGLNEQERRTFLSHASCRPGLGLREGQDYLIIGPITDVWHAGGTSNKYVYTLGKDTWVERWPSESECGAGSTLEEKCGALKSFEKALTESGCQT